MTRPESEPQRNRLDDLVAARGEVRAAAVRLARERGADFVTRPAWPGAKTDIQDLRPLDGARSARDIEQAARYAARGYIRDAREAGHSWQEIGEALGVTPAGDADQAGESVAEAAYTYAAGQPDPDDLWRPRTFPWHCRSCDQTISDHGLADHPADNEAGHTDNCPRLADAVAEWNASWQADWEAEP